MLRLRPLVFLVVVVSVTVTSHISSPSFADVTKKQIKELETVFLPAWNQGNNLLILESLGSVVHKMSAKEIAEVDELLALQQIPKSAQVLVEARLHLLRRGRHKDLPRMGVRELMLTLENLDEEFAKALTEAESLPKQFEEQADKTSFRQFKEQLWDTHVLGQKLVASITLAQYAAYIAKNNQKRLKRKLNKDQAKQLNKDYEKVEATLSNALKNINEHEILVRMKRLEFAHQLVGNDSPLKDRYLATWSLQTDGRIVTEALSNQQPVFNSPVLNNPELSEQVQAQIKSGIELAGKGLVKKSGLLFTGLHWWMRGRYGMGSEAFGFMKSESAVTSDAALFPLYMPEETPIPTSLSSEEAIPEIDRRHKYIWEWEYRRISSRASKRSTSKVVGGTVTSETRLSRFY